MRYELEEPSATGEPRFEVFESRGGLYSIAIGGRLPYDWAGRLSSGLARSGVSILYVDAKRGERNIWRGRFDVEPLAGGLDPRRIDYPALMEREPPAPYEERWDLEIDKYRVGSPRDHAGALYVEIEGRDRPGFLGALLGHFASVTLFPYEMVIRTGNDTVNDVFILKCIGGAEPSAKIHETMEYILDMIANKRY